MRFLPAAGAAPAEVRRVLAKPWPWEIAGPFPAQQKLDEVLASPATTWQRLPSVALLDRYDTLDFRKPFGKDARGRVVLRCRLRCAAEGEYLWLFNSDDNSIVWLDGKQVLANPRSAPAEGFLTRARMSLTAGEHTVVAAVHQADFAEGDIYTSSLNQWKFRLRIRADDHQPAPVEGIPWNDAPGVQPVPAGTVF